jgi:hypothetical protein
MTGNATNFQDVLAAVRQADRALARAVDRDRIEDVREAEAHLALAHWAASNHPCHTPEELSAQLRFLIDRLARRSDDGEECADYRALCDLLSRRIEDLLGSPHDRLATAAAKPHNAPDPLDNLSVSEFVSRAEDRVSIIGVDYSYLRTSAGNAKFYDTDPDRLHGRHVGEIIGEKRFETRARARLDACFRGHVQDYTHTLEIWRDNRIMNCRMTPVRDRNDTLIGAQVTMRDVTSLYLGEEQIAT